MAAQTLYSDTQIVAWLRGLLTIAWADGHFDPEEQALIAQLTQDELAPQTDLGNLQPIAPAELAAALGDDVNIRENFLRTAVMMALANGVYSLDEAQVINTFLTALDLDIAEIEALEQTLYDPAQPAAEGATTTLTAAKPTPPAAVLHPVRDWLDGMEVHDPRLARFLCKMIPAQCPFERDVVLFGHKVVHIPPMCKLNPLYEQLVGLRFRALSYLADDCGEDVTRYC
ncbi:MAG: nitrogenase [Spirulinaceae cyanobacterium SM2_1_0]|nr:nitrogenase [Spirulinaceae cyanobacterium SM2_1_0]